MPRTPRFWTPEEDEALRLEMTEYLEKEKAIDWCQIASKLPGRTNKDCRKRWHNAVAGGLNKGQWSKAEDDLLRRGIEKHGQKWTQVAEMVQTRSADQCAKRWQQVLDPNLDHSQWTDRDNQVLLDAVQKIGRRWTHIQRLHFPGRSKNSIKNRYSINARKMKKRNSLDMDRSGPSKRPTWSDQTSRTFDFYSNGEDDEDGEDEEDDDDEEDEDSDDPQSNNSKTADHKKYFHKARTHQGVSTGWNYEDHSSSAFIPQNLTFPGFDLSDASPTGATGPVSNSMTTPLAAEFSPSTWSCGQPDPADLMGTTFWTDLRTPNHDDSIAMELSSLGPNVSRSINTANSVPRRGSGNPTAGLFLSEEQSGMQESEMKRSHKSPEDQGKVHFTLTMNQPSVDTLQSLMLIAIQSQAKFRVEKE